MPLPEREAAFDRLLARLKLQRPPPKDGQSWRSIVVVDPGRATGGEVAEEARLWFVEEPGALTFDALVERLARELERSGHAASERLGWVVLALVCASSPDGRATASALNARLADLASCEATLVHVLPFALSGFEVEFGRFRLASAPWDLLVEACASAGSGWCRAHERSIRSRLAIERTALRTAWIAWPDLPASVPVAALLDAYAEEIGQALFGGFWRDFTDDQDLQVAAGAPPLEERVLRSFTPSFSVAVLRPTPPGRVRVVAVPSSGSRAVLGLDRRIRRAQKDVQTWFGPSPSTGDLDPTIMSFVRQLAKARRHALDGKTDDAFLSYMIALELLLGREIASVDAFASRVGVLVHRQRGVTIEVQAARARALYNVRSRYVHDGQAVSGSVLDDVECLAREVLACVLRAARGRSRDFLPRWIAQLDLVAASHAAGEPASDERFAMIGVSSTTG